METNFYTADILCSNKFYVQYITHTRCTLFSKYCKVPPFHRVKNLCINYHRHFHVVLNSSKFNSKKREMGWILWCLKLAWQAQKLDHCKCDWFYSNYIGTVNQFIIHVADWHAGMSEKKMLLSADSAIHQAVFFSLADFITVFSTILCL